MGRFGAYMLHEQLGSGERGTVHRATVVDGDDSRPSVAIKRFPTRLFLSEQAAARHAADVARASQLRHPNIAEVYRVGRYGDSTFVEMEHVVGTSLEEILLEVRTGGPPPIEVAISLIAELCDALAFAHGRGLVHGDIRPRHLLVEPMGRLRVVGFGMAELGYARSQDSYAAPELTDGAAAEARADLFSVGVVAYELITGRPLFGDGMDPQLRSCIGSRVAPPSTCNPDCSPALDAIVLRALASEPGERWDGADGIRLAMMALGGPMPQRVQAWLERDAAASYPPMVTLTPAAPPDPPVRTARGSARIPPSEVAGLVGAYDRRTHEAATEIRPPGGSGLRSLRLPIEPPPETDDDGGDEADDGILVITDDDLDQVVSGLALGSQDSSIAEQVLQPLPQTAESRRYLELVLAFVAGALVMCVVLALLG